MHIRFIRFPIIALVVGAIVQPAVVLGGIIGSIAFVMGWSTFGSPD